jgi:tetratricopeptide (TPR) repeat protein
MVIRIREKSADGNGFTATLSFDGEGECEILVKPPFTEEEEQRLEWYFERHLDSPFTDGVKAREAGVSVRKGGEALFQAVFSDRDAYAQYTSAKNAGVENIRFEIIGSPEFQKVHWEAMCDPNLPQPLSVLCAFSRKAQKLQVNRAALQPSPVIRLLIVTARSGKANDVSYRTIQRPLLETFRKAKLRVQADILRPGIYEALSKHLDERGAGYYHVIHFDAHGAVGDGQQITNSMEPNNLSFKQPYGRSPIKDNEATQAFLFLAGDEPGTYDPVRAADLANLLTTKNVPVVLLNACQSAKETGSDETTSLANRLMEAGVQTAVAMAYSVTVSGAEILMKALYDGLADHGDLSRAIRTARLELYNRKERNAYFGQKISLEDWLLPVVYQNSEQKLTTRDFAAGESAAFYAKQTARYAEPTTAYGFFGRDLDILRIENRLLRDGNILLIRGMGGAGKTTLLKHLGAWWQETDFVEKVFYFGYDEKAHTRQQILHTLAASLLTPVERARDFDPLPIEAQQALLVQKLKATRHLLILDNLESITGEQMAVQNTLPVNEQNALHGFLRALNGGDTLVLLGSRSDEAWLAPGTFDKNVHALGGLDPQAASELADAILRRIHKTEYRRDMDFLRLLRLLDGYPLALQIVLANLERQTPKEIIEALQAGDVQLDKKDGKDKTESILRCIEYAHSNLDSDAQNLLTCLMPFVGVFYTGFQDEYINTLSQQPTLAHLPFARFGETLKTAERWGLVSTDGQLPGYLRLQPTLSFFLSSRLSDAASAPVQEAIATAFRLHYEKVGGMLSHLMQSKEPAEKQTGQVLVGTEYENLLRALRLSLGAHVPILEIYVPLSFYLDTRQEQERGLLMGEEVSRRIQEYPKDILAGQTGLELISVIDNIAKRQMLLKRYIEAEASYKMALSLLSENAFGDKKIKALYGASISHQLGVVAQEQRQWAQAEQYYKQALEIKIQCNARDSQASTYHQLGRVTQEQRQWAQAEQYYKQALEINIQCNDRYSQATTYAQLGNLARDQHQLPQAEQYYKQALQIFVEFNDLYNQASVYHQLGNLAQEQHQLPQAEQYYKQALQIMIEFNDRYQQASTFHNLGIVAQEQRQWAQAEQYFKQALQISVEFNDLYNQAITYHQLGRVAEKQHQWTQARDYYLTSLTLFVKFEDRHNASMALISLVRLWRESGDASLPATAAPIIGATPEQMLAWFEGVAASVNTTEESEPDAQ